MLGITASEITTSESQQGFGITDELRQASQNSFKLPQRFSNLNFLGRETQLADAALVWSTAPLQH
jgi:hypothetical protein